MLHTLDTIYNDKQIRVDRQQVQIKYPVLY